MYAALEKREEVTIQGKSLKTYGHTNQSRLYLLFSEFLMNLFVVYLFHLYLYLADISLSGFYTDPPRPLCDRLSATRCHAQALAVHSGD